MRVTASSPVAMDVKRVGGALILVRADVWSNAPSGWKLEGSLLLQDPGKKQQQGAVTLGAGDYRVVFSCRVEEGVNGVFDYAFSVGSTQVFTDQGNVDKTAAANEARNFQDEFDLTVQ